MRRKDPLWVLGLVLVLFSACKVSKTMQHVPYFTDLPDSDRTLVRNYPFTSLVIHSDDLLSISIETITSASSRDLGLQTAGLSSRASSSSDMVSSTSTAVPSSQNSPNTFRVDKDGNVNIPLIGLVHISGLDIVEARNLIQKKASLYYNSPVVNIRYLNLRVTILGEVLHPGTYQVYGEKNTIYDALGLAGDLTIYGRRDNLLLLRDSAGISVMNRFGLNSSELPKKNFYYLRQNDVIYVSPNSAKMESLRSPLYTKITVAVSVLTLLILLITKL